MRNAARHAYEIAGLRPGPRAVELEVEHALLHKNELILGRVDVNRHELARFAVCLESKGGVANRLGKIKLAQDVPALAAVTSAACGNSLLQCSHGSPPWWNP